MSREHLTGVPATTHWAKRFTALGAADGISSYVLLAQVEERIVGLVRFDRTAGTSVVEIGILLVDSWQSRGLGQRMIAQLAAEARQTLTDTDSKFYSKGARASSSGTCDARLPVVTDTMTHDDRQ